MREDLSKVQISNCDGSVARAVSLLLLALFMSNSLTFLIPERYRQAIEIVERGEIETNGEKGKHKEKAETDKYLDTLLRSGLGYSKETLHCFSVDSNWHKPWMEIATPPPEIL